MTIIRGASMAQPMIYHAHEWTYNFQLPSSSVQRLAMYAVRLSRLRPNIGEGRPSRVADAITGVCDHGILNHYHQRFWHRFRYSPQVGPRPHPKRLVGAHSTLHSTLARPSAPMSPLSTSPQAAPRRHVALRPHTHPPA